MFLTANLTQGLPLHETTVTELAEGVRSMECDVERIAVMGGSAQTTRTSWLGRLPDKLKETERLTSERARKGKACKIPNQEDTAIGIDTKPSCGLGLAQYRSTRCEVKEIILGYTYVPFRCWWHCCSNNVSMVSSQRNASIRQRHCWIMPRSTECRFETHCSRFKIYKSMALPSTLTIIQQTIIFFSA